MSFSEYWPKTGVGRSLFLCTAIMLVKHRFLKAFSHFSVAVNCTDVLQPIEAFTSVIML